MRARMRFAADDEGRSVISLARSRGRRTASPASTTPRASSRPAKEAKRSTRRWSPSGHGECRGVTGATWRSESGYTVSFGSGMPGCVSHGDADESGIDTCASDGKVVEDGAPLLGGASSTSA